MQKKSRRVLWIAVALIGVVVLLVALNAPYDRFVPTTRPFVGATLYQSDPTLPVAEYAKSHPDAKWAQQMARYPRSHWLADDRSVNDLPQWLAGVDQQGALPVLVVYRIPNRDCGGGSADSAPLNAGEYYNWIDRMVRNLGQRPAVLIYEPDALAADCFADDDEARAEIMQIAIQKIVRAGYTLYIDAGDVGHPGPRETKRRLLKVGVEKVQGFALNVSSYYPTTDTIGYGEALAEQLGRRHFVIDTSRNGRGLPADRTGSQWWCNPRDVGLGERPTTDSGHELVDALLWVKNPDLSDGCRPGDPPAGAFFPQQARRLADQAVPPLS